MLSESLPASYASTSTCVPPLPKYVRARLHLHRCLAEIDDMAAIKPTRKQDELAVHVLMTPQKTLRVVLHCWMMDDTLFFVSLEPWKRSHKSIASR